MNYRRLVGIDLGIASAHTVRVLDGEGTTVAKRKAWPTVESLSEVETAALVGCPPGTRLEVVVERRARRRCRSRGSSALAATSASGVVDEGGGSAPVPVPAHQDQRHRR